jgi:hypothetical protein
MTKLWNQARAASKRTRAVGDFKPYDGIVLGQLGHSRMLCRYTPDKHCKGCGYHVCSCNPAKVTVKADWPSLAYEFRPCRSGFYYAANQSSFQDAVALRLWRDSLADGLVCYRSVSFADLDDSVDSELMLREIWEEMHRNLTDAEKR